MNIDIDKLYPCVQKNIDGEKIITDYIKNKRQLPYRLKMAAASYAISVALSWFPMLSTNLVPELLIISPSVSRKKAMSSQKHKPQGGHP